MSDYPDNWPGFTDAEDMLCEHHACRCARANELASMGLVPDAIRAHEERVRCRQRPAHNERTDA